jgi:hypothetical protein
VDVSTSALLINVLLLVILGSLTLPNSFGEMTIGIFAANVPCLKSQFQRVFKALGEHLTTRKGTQRTAPTTNSRGTKVTDIQLSDSESTCVEPTKISDKPFIMATDDLEANPVDEFSKGDDDGIVYTHNHHAGWRSQSIV